MSYLWHRLRIWIREILNEIHSGTEEIFIDADSKMEEYLNEVDSRIKREGINQVYTRIEQDHNKAILE